MPVVVKITGMQQVLSNLKKAANKTSINIERGLVKGGQYLQAESMMIVPVQTGNLRGSAFTRRVAKNHIIVGYTAPYAGFVHEVKNAAHGHAFNVKHQALITSRPAREARRRKLHMKSDVITDPYFKRGEKQQWKFLEKPAREKRTQILVIVAAEARKN